MRYVMIGWFLAATTGAVLGQEFSPHPVAFPVPAAAAPATPSYERLEHLLRAAVHLEAAGLPQRADELWRQAEDEKRALRARVHAFPLPQPAVPRPVADVRQVLVRVKILEIPRDRLARLGLACEQVSSGLIVKGQADTGMQMAVLSSDPQTQGLLAALEKDNLVRVLASPTVVTLSGQPAHVEIGAPTTVPVYANGEACLAQRFCGIRMDALPIVLPDGKIRLEFRASVSELDPQRQVQVQGIAVPAIQERAVDTAVEMQSGQTFVLSGLITRHKADQKAAKPEASTLTQTLVLATAEIVAPTEAREVVPRR